MSILKKINTGWILLLILTASSCRSNGENSLLKYFGLVDTANVSAGVITGTVVNDEDKPASGVEIRTFVTGKTYSTQTKADGTFQLDVAQVQRMDGLTLQLSLDGHQGLNKALVFELPNLRAETGELQMTAGTQDYPQVKVSGRILDSLSNQPLVGASVQTLNALSQPVTTISNSDGVFEFTSAFASGSSYSIMVSESNHLERSDLIFSVENEEVSFGDILLQRITSNISGVVKGLDGKLLENVTVSLQDSSSSSITASTDASGKFSLNGDYIFLNENYILKFTQEDFDEFSLTITPNSIQESTGEVILNPAGLRNYTISATIYNANNSSPLPGATLQIINALGQAMQATTDASGRLTLNGLFKDGVDYSVTISASGYESKIISSGALTEGLVNLSAVNLSPATLSGTINGTVRDQDGQALPGAVLTVKLDENTISTGVSDANGAYSISAGYQSGNRYSIFASHSNEAGTLDYTGPSGKLALVELNWGANSQETAPDLNMFIIGIRAKVNGQTFYFNSSSKQSNEIFLTGKNGFTLSARNGSDKNTASTLYLHLDEEVKNAARAMPSFAPDTRSTALPLNGASRKGVLAEGIAGDSRTTTWKLKNYLLYRIFVNTPGPLLIQTSGETDTYLELSKADSGNILAQDNNSGENNNARISYDASETGWYFVKVRGASDNNFGFFNISAKGPEQSAETSLLTSWSTNDLVLSYYHGPEKTLYIAGFNEPGSQGTVSIKSYESVGKTIRGTFFGTLRPVKVSGASVSLTEGYFNIIRGE